MSALLASPDLGEALAFLLDCALKGSVVILIAAAVAWMLRRESAAARHTVWSAAIAAQLLIPIMGLILPTWRVGLVDAPSWAAVSATTPIAAPAVREASQTPQRTTLPTVPVKVEETPSSTTAPSETSPSSTTAPTEVRASRPSALFIVAALWILGCVVVLGRLIAGTAVVSRMAVRGERVVDEQWLGLMNRLAVRLGISRPLTLLRGDSLGVPVTWGNVYPIVFLPSDADQWPEDRRRYVLVHEMAHVKRLDAFTQLVAQFTLAVFWFNPLAWMAAGRMRRERENACDDYVLTHGTKPSEYASDLLEIVRSIGTRNHGSAAPAFAALAMARRSEFEGRMLSILDPEIRRTSLSRKGVAMSVITAALIIAPLAAFSPFTSHDARLSAVRSDSTAIGINTNTKLPAKSGALPPAPNVTSVSAAAPAATLITKIGSESSAAPSEAVPLTHGTQTAPCDRMGSPTNSTSIHDNSDDPDSRSIQYVRRSPARCIEAVLVGRVAFSDDEKDIVSMARGAHARFRERTVGSDREMVLIRDGDQVRHDYEVNGRGAEYDDAARAWFGTMVLTMLRESGYNAQARIRRLRQQGGTALVLAEIDSIVSSGAKRAYYEAVLEDKSLSSTELARFISRARRDIESDGDLRSILEKAGRLNTQSAEVRVALADAIAGIGSDGDKTAVITSLAWTADKNLLAELMRVAKTIGSDGDKSNFLTTTAARFLTGKDPVLRDGFFSVANTIGSDGDSQRVYVAAAPYGHGDDAITIGIIRGTLRMGSSGDRANVLVAVANQRLLTTEKISAEYLAAANRIDSDGDRARALAAAIKR